MFSKNSYLKSKLRIAAIMLLSIIMALSMVFAAACSDDEEETTKTTSSSDTQTILNGNFEFFSDSDDETYIIYDPNNWSSTTSGNTNYVMNGIIDTSEANWDNTVDNTINADSLAATLNYNNALDEDSDDYDYDDEYVDYNGMKSRDIPYKNTYAGINGESLDGEKEYYTIYKVDNGDGTYSYYYLENDDDDDLDNDTKVEVFNPTVDSDGETYYTDDNGDGKYYDKVRIDNPYTHNIVTTVSGQAYAATYVADTDETHGTTEYKEGDKVKLYADDDGNYYYDEEHELPYESHVLMIHNYVNDDTRYGTAQSYSSSTTVTLQPNTAAELSVWVKTDQLIYDRNGSEIYEGRGAYIEVEQTVGGTSVDSLYIENIRTDGVTANNGWVKYTVYVTGCDFAESTITITLGLGQAASPSDYSEVCEGYAFFDDVKCTVYSSLDQTTYNTVVDGGTTVNSCTLIDDEDAKIFSFDVHNTFTTITENDKDVETLSANDSYYYIDLSSQRSQTDIAITSNDTSTTSDTTIDYTRDSDYYITASESTASSGITGYNLSSTNKYQSSSTGYKVNYLANDKALDTSYDVLGIYQLGTNLTTDINNSKSTGSGYDYYSNTIQNVLGSYYDEDYSGNALMILSAYGSAYTATITDTTNFIVDSQGYKIVSFWIKTSDMADYSAATVTVYAYQYDSDGNLLDASGEVTTNRSKAVIDTSLASSLSVDTTGVTYDVGDEEDIYNGWVQCFFYIENTTDYEIEFEIQVGFGNTAFADTDASDYKSGYLAVTNIQTMDVDEDIYDLTSTGTYAASLTLSTSDARENNYFDSTATVDSNNIETNVTNPSSYTGVNGGSASVVYTENLDTSGLDSRNSNDNAGMINQDYWENYINEYSNDKTNSAYDWLNLILSYNGLNIDDALTTLSEVYSNVFGSASIQPLLIANTVRTYYEEDNTTIKSAAMNYGFIANSTTSVSSDSYEIITVKVYVSKGAVAYVYLTENDGTSSDVTTLNLPQYTFYYDYQGNVLDGKPDYDDESYNEKDHIVYYIRDDGLYEDAEGTLYANLYNYSKWYYDQTAEYWVVNEDNSVDSVIYEDVDSDTVYYASESEAQKAANGESATMSPHYLVAYDSDGNYTRVFLYNNTQFSDSAYHYVITETDDDDEETVSYSDAVYCFDTSVAPVRYNNTDTSDSAMYAVVDARYGYNASGELELWAGKTASTADISELGYDANGNYVADTWQTVSFYIHTGDTAYDYTVELWSGARETTGTTVTDNAVTLTDDASAEGTFVAFDLSNMTSDEDTYADLLEEYTNEIIDAYVRILSASGNLTEGAIKDSDQNLEYYIDLYDSLVEEGKITESNYNTSASAYYSYWQIINNLRHVQYYTYTLYDDAGYVPFNAETAADDETGYNYAPGDYEETLVFLSYVTGYTDTDGKTYVANYVTFVDYSASDVTVDTNTADEEEDEDEDDDSTFNVWLLVASIILAVVLIFTMISLLVRDIVKRIRRNRINVKNVYSGKRKHYIRKLGLTETTEEPDETEPSDKNE